MMQRVEVYHTVLTNEDQNEFTLSSFWIFGQYLVHYLCIDLSHFV
jgi:hypothetical protein